MEESASLLSFLNEIDSNNLKNFLFLLQFMLSAIINYRLAKSRNRNYKLWALIGFLSPISSIILFFLPKKKKTIRTPLKETAGKAAPVAHNDNAAAINDDSFNIERPPRLSNSRSLNWYYIDSANETSIKGPFNVNELRKEIHSNNLPKSTYIWCEEFDDWQMISTFSNASLLLDRDFIE